MNMTAMGLVLSIMACEWPGTARGQVRVDTRTNQSSAARDACQETTSPGLPQDETMVDCELRRQASEEEFSSHVCRLLADQGIACESSIIFRSPRRHIDHLLDELLFHRPHHVASDGSIQSSIEVLHESNKDGFRLSLSERIKPYQFIQVVSQP